MLSEEEIKNIKNQIVGQIDSTFPPEQKEAAKSQVMAMNSSELENFLQQNKIVSQSGNPAQKCIFCSIASKETESVIIDENKKAIAVLEINPISTGHTIIIPKEHIPSENKLPKEAMELANEVARKIKKLSPKKIDVIPSNMFGHEILNVLPIYNDENLNSEKKPVKKEDLEYLKEDLKEKPRPKIIKKPQTKKINNKKEKLWLPKRIP